MSELKPCPFCGSEQPQDSKDDGNVPYEFGMSRSCNSCSAAVNLGWNTRPIEDALRVQLARRDALIERLVEVGNDIVEEAQLQEPDVQELRDNWRVLIAEAEWKPSKDGGEE